jgi:1-acyl-sn-glycerol-3-phosphate acyltransferase
MSEASTGPESPPKRVARPRTELVPLRPWAKALYAAFRVVVTALARLGWRLEVTGRDRLPTVGPFVLAPVHRSNLDFLIAGLAVPRRMRFMAKDSIWKAERFGRFIESVGAFPVDRDNPDRAALRKAEATVALSEPVVMFPEGTRREGPVVEDLFDGPAWVACRQRVPLVPMAIGGADRAMPIGSKMIRFTKVRVVIGEPIYPDVPLTGRVPRRVVTEVTDELNKELQALYDQVR